MPDTVFVPLLNELAPDGFFYGGHYIVEFDPDSLWYETSLTIAALALKHRIKTEYHVFQHYPSEAIDGLSRLGVDTKKLEEEGLLSIIDSYTQTLEYESAKKKKVKVDLKSDFAGFAPTSAKPLDIVKSAKNWTNAAKAGYTAEEKRWLHIDDNTSIFLQYNDENAVVDTWRIAQLPYAIRARETPHFLAWVKGIASEAFYTKFEALCDGIIDLKTQEEGGRINNYIRLRMLRGKTFDSRWHRIELGSGGEVKLLGSFSEPEQRKLAAIMFTDIVGYTSLTQKNETLALELLEKHRNLLRPIFLKGNGREVKTIGDSFLVEFDSALDAVNCAVKIQAFLHDYNLSTSGALIRLRIGIHVGDVVHKADDILGDAVNIASRIEPLAEPEGACISEQVFDQVHNKTSYQLEQLEKAELKNVNFPTTVYAIMMPWREDKAKLSDVQNDRIESNRLRVAVLPFSNMSPDPNDEYFSDGITEELISTISNIKGLAVISRTSAMQFKNVSKKMLDIGQELNAGSVLEGSVRKAGNQLRIAVQLIDVRSDQHVWTETYDRTLDDVFAIQSDIAERVARSLEIKLLTSERNRIEKARTTKSEAHTLYLKGRYFWNERTEQSIKKAIEYFRLATEKDPNYALAYSGMADCYTIMSDFGYISPKEAFSKATDSALNALKIDPDLAEAHASYALSLEGLWDFEGAEREFKLAIRLNPNYATAHQWYGLHLERARRFDEALQEIEKATELDPLSLQIRSNTAVFHVSIGDYDEAISRLKSLLVLEPDFSPAYIWLVTAYTAKGMLREALEEIELKRGQPSGSIRMSIFGNTFARAGMLKEANDVIEQLKERSKHEFVDPMLFAGIYSCMNMKEEAFEWLEKAYDEHSQLLIYLQIYPWFASLRSDSRYLSLVKRVGFK